MSKKYSKTGGAEPITAINWEELSNSTVRKTFLCANGVTEQILRGNGNSDVSALFEKRNLKLFTNYYYGECLKSLNLNRDFCPFRYIVKVRCGPSPREGRDKEKESLSHSIRGEKEQRGNQSSVKDRTK